MRYSLLVALIPVLLGAGCPSERSVDPRNSITSADRVTQNGSESGRGSVDPCNLITSAEIEALQGEPVIDTKSTGRAGGGLAFSQCFFSLAEFTKSVSLEVTRTDPNHVSPVDPARHWKELFHRDPEEYEKAGVPVRVDGVGEEAFWIGDTRVGALYVLQDRTYFRISVGGQEDRSEKIEKTKNLAQKALKRL